MLYIFAFNIIVFQYFTSNLHQLFWMRFYFLDTEILQKYVKGNSHCLRSHYNKFAEKSLFHSHSSPKFSKLYVLILSSGLFNLLKLALGSCNSLLLSIFFLATGDIICGPFWFCFSDAFFKK